MFIYFFHLLFWSKYTKYFYKSLCKKALKLLTFLLKYKIFDSANQEVADYQSSLAQISCMRITATIIERLTSK